jgi:mannose-6-phosphate isomerase-like protein (cupin superfamily)
MRILKSSQEPVDERPDGASARYFRFPNLQVHINVIASGALQGWHRHEMVREYFVVTSGEIDMHWRNDAGLDQSERLRAGDVAFAESSVHTLGNSSGAPAQFIVIKAILAEADSSELFRMDRIAEPQFQ